MNVAEKRNRSRIIKLEGALLAFWPGAQVVSQLLVAANRGPEDIVGNRVAILEVDRSADLHDRDMGREHQALLINQRVLGWRRKSFTLDDVHINHRLARDA